jgi:hypothetical protein
MENCFELFGLDFMMDVDLNVSLLEVNPGPDVKQTGQKLKRVIESLWEGVFDIAVDRSPSPLTFVEVYRKQWSASNMKGGGGMQLL